MLARLLVAAALLFGVPATSVSADEVSDKQKKAAEENLTKSEVTKGVVGESENLLVAGPMSDTKAKAVAEALQKTYKLARKALQYEEKEEPWKGKLTVYVLPEKTYKLFLRVVSGQRPEEPYRFIAIRGDEPYVVCATEITEKSAEADVAADAGPIVATALLNAKIGTATPVPEWVRMGFGRAAALRAEGTNSRRFGTYKTAARNAVFSGKTAVGDVWGGQRKDGEVLSTSLMDYIAFGPGAANFSKFLGGFKPSETVAEPTIAQALEAAMWKEPTLDATWKKWINGGMMVK